MNSTLNLLLWFGRYISGLPLHEFVSTVHLQDSLCPFVDCLHTNPSHSSPPSTTTIIRREHPVPFSNWEKDSQPFDDLLKFIHVWFGLFKALFQNYLCYFFSLYAPTYTCVHEDSLPMTSSDQSLQPLPYRIIAISTFSYLQIPY